MAAKRAPAELPEFQSDRLRLLGPLITPQALELARSRILDPRKRLVREKREMDHPEGVVKMALLLVVEMNPCEVLTNEEEGVRRGVSAETIGKRRSAGDL